MGNSVSFMVSKVNYTIAKELERGVFGVTFLATDPKGNKYTVKMAFPMVDQKLFEREVNSLKAVYYHLNHVCDPHLQCFVDMFVVDADSPNYEKIWVSLRLPTDAEQGYGLPLRGIISRYLAGENLLEVISSKNYDTNRLAKMFLDQMLPAVQFLHEHQITHRDIKLENIIYNTETNTFTLIDFGLACVKDCPGEVQGTPGYIHPDVFKAPNTVNYRKSDVFALGIVLYEIMTAGNYPFVMNGNVPDLSQYIGISFLDQDLDRMRQLLLFKPDQGINNMALTWEDLNYEDL